MNKLTQDMDNVLAHKLGEIAYETLEGDAGDLIDTGLILRRLLDENGFSLVLQTKEFEITDEKIDKLNKLNKNKR